MGIQVATVPPDEKITKDTVLFTTGDGEQVREYRPVRHVGPAVQLRFMRYLRKEGTLYAIADLMEHVVGSEAMDVITSDESLTPENYRALADLVERAAVGVDPLGPSGAEGSSEAR